MQCNRELILSIGKKCSHRLLADNYTGYHAGYSNNYRASRYSITASVLRYINFSIAFVCAGVSIVVFSLSSFL